MYNVLGSGRTVHAGSTAPRGILLAPNNDLDHPYGVWKGIVICRNVLSSNQINRFVCPPQPVAPPPPPPSQNICPYFENTCPGLVSGSSLLLPLKNQVVSFKDYDVVAFGNLYCHGGDVEGRVAVQGNIDVDSFGVGFELWTVNGPDAHTPYSLIVGGNANWGMGGGQVWPFGNNIDKHPCTEEDIFVGGTYNGPAYQLARITGSCGSNPGCLNQWFNGANNCYTGISMQYATSTPNVAASLVYGGLQMSCNNPTDTQYIVTIDSTLFNQANYYFLDNCNFHAQWIVNIVGNGNVLFTGGSFPAVAGGVLFNVPGTGRLVEIRSIGLNGHLLAPGNDLNQTSSVIVGKVVVRNYIQMNQVNRPCPNVASNPVQVTAYVAPSDNVSPGSIALGNNAILAGDYVSGLGVCTSATPQPQGEVITIQGVSGAAPGTVLTTLVQNPYAPRTNGATPAPSISTPSSASNLVAFFGVIAALLALF